MSAKLIYRHPHVFGDDVVETSDEVINFKHTLLIPICRDQYEPRLVGAGEVLMRKNLVLVGILLFPFAFYQRKVLKQ
jgi:hypothetical protein